MKKTLAAITLAGSIALIGAVPAMADDATNYNAAPANGFVSDGSPAAGQMFTFSGAGFEPGEAVTITVGSKTFKTTADANGKFTFQLSISETGTYTLTAKGAAGHVVTSTVTVEGASLASTSNGAGTALADTGADSSLLLWSLVGGGALAAGITSVVVVRRRANADAAV